MGASNLTPAAVRDVSGQGEPLPDDLRAAVSSSPDGASFVSRLLYFTEVTSTNDVATTLARRGAPEGTIVAAGEQTAGRGRQGRDWFSAPDAGLYVSVVFRGEQLAVLTLMTGVALAEAMRSSTGLIPEIKWPNDLVVRHPATRAARKLAGILVEASGSGSTLDFAIVGFGINVRAPAGLPRELLHRAISIEEELGRPVDRGAVLGHALGSLGRWRAAVLRDGPGLMLDRWRELAPSHHGAAVEFEGASGWTSGTTDGIDDGGALRVRTAQGVVQIVAGELRWREL